VGRAGANQAVGSTSLSNKDPIKSALDTESISFSALPLLVGRTRGETSFGDTLGVTLLLYLRVIRSYVLTVEQQSHKYAIVASFSSSTTHFYDGGPGHTATRGRHAAAQRTSLLAAGLVSPQWLYLSLSLSCSHAAGGEGPIHSGRRLGQIPVRADFPHAHQQATSREFAAAR
ncbi:unnamed protein product, partial [Ectocarpus sp. 12 AP-2014]